MEFVAYLVNFFIIRRLIEGSGIKIIGSESQSFFISKPLLTVMCLLVIKNFLLEVKLQ